MRVEMLSHGTNVVEQFNAHGQPVRVADWVAVELDAAAWEMVGRCVLTVLRCAPQLNVDPRLFPALDKLGNQWADVHEMIVKHIEEREQAQAIEAATKLVNG